MMSPISNRKRILSYRLCKTITLYALVVLLVGLFSSPVALPLRLLAPKAAQAAVAIPLVEEEPPAQNTAALSVSQLTQEKNDSTAVATAPNAHASALSGSASISGLVYSDVNANGAKDTAEVGVGSVTVTAYDSTGATIANTSTVTATGQYTLSHLPADMALRLEFTSLPAGYQPSGHSQSTEAGIQFVTTTSGALRNINLGVQVPDDYCQTNPNVCTTLFLSALQNAMLTLASNIPADAISTTYTRFRQNSVPDAQPSSVGTEGEQADALVAIQAGFVQFGDRAWLESDADGLIATGVITPIAGLLITATNGTQVYTATTNSQGYYSFTVEAGTYTVTYGSVPVAYGTATASEIPGGNQANGDAGHYQEPGKSDQNHANGTVVTLTDGQANWQIDFVFHAPQSALRLVKQVTPQVAKAGDTLIYTLQVINDGPDTATAVQVQDLLPATVIYQSAMPQQGAYDTNTSRWDVGTIAVDSSVTLTITVTVK